MTLEAGRSEQSEDKYLGLTTLQCAGIIVAENPLIERVNLRCYFYIPEKPSGEDEKLIALDRETFLNGKVLQKLMMELSEGWNISFDSKVKDKDGNMQQLPMMDLSLQKSEENLARTKDRLERLIVPRFGGGYILETQKSYHFFGKKLLDHEEWLRFLGFSLLTSIVTVASEGQENIHELVSDYRYVGHSLIRGSTGLRITANGSKSVLPRIVSVV